MLRIHVRGHAMAKIEYVTGALAVAGLADDDRALEVLQRTGGEFGGGGGHAVDQDGVAPANFNATIATALGLPLAEVVHSPTGRPFKVAHDGTPISKLL